MKNGRTVVIAGLLIVLALFGYSYNTNKASTPASPEIETPVTSTANKQGAAAEAIEQGKNNGESMWLLFRSTTCVPCVEMQKVFDQLQPEYIDKVHFIAIDVNDSNPS